MKRYTVSVEVLKIYHVDVDGENEDEATTMAGEMSTVKLDAEGSLENVESEAIEIENEEDIDEDE